MDVYDVLYEIALRLATKEEKKRKGGKTSK
jgi:hypothetical protein